MMGDGPITHESMSNINWKLCELSERDRQTQSRYEVRRSWDNEKWIQGKLEEGAREPS